MGRDTSTGVVNASKISKTIKAKLLMSKERLKTKKTMIFAQVCKMLI